MSDKRCGNCKHRGEEALDNPDFFLCGRVKHGNSCDNDYDESGIKASEGAYVSDGSGYYAALCVSTDFGCALWESRS